MTKFPISLIAVAAAAAIICTGGVSNRQNQPWPTPPLILTLQSMNEGNGVTGTPYGWSAVMETSAASSSSTTGSYMCAAGTTTGHNDGVGGTTGSSGTGGAVYFEVPTQSVGLTITEDPPSTATSRQIIDPKGNQITVTAWPIAANDHANWSTSNGPAFTSQAFTFYLERTSVSGYHLGQPIYESEVWKYVNNIVKQPCQSVSIDSRMMYGSPDATGQPQGLDPNSVPHSVNFSNWIYLGGLFLGNSPIAPNGDQSRTARLQVYPTPIYPSPPAEFHSPWGATLSALNMGPSTAVGTAPVVSAFSILTSDPNYNVLPTAVTWATAWNVGNSPLPANTDMSQIPTNALANWPISGFTVTNNGTSYNNISLTVNNESGVISSGTAYWNYFESATYQAAQTSYPLNDGQPRLWVLDCTSNPTTSYYKLTNPSISGP